MPSPDHYRTLRLATECAAANGTPVAIPIECAQFVLMQHRHRVAAKARTIYAAKKRLGTLKRTPSSEPEPAATETPSTIAPHDQTPISPPQEAQPPQDPVVS